MSTRRWDGEPETEFDARFFGLRESGYTGPIDQDGYAVTTGEDAAILKRMADQRGEDTSWWTGEPPERGVDRGPGSRPAALLAGLLLVAVVMVVITGISHLRGW